MPTWRVVAAASVEVRGPMLYATLIMVIAAAPLLIMHGLSAEFFRPLAWSYITAIVASLVVATTVTPALALLLAPKPTVLQPGGSAFVSGLQRFYGRGAGWAMRSPAPAFALVAAGILLGALIWSHQGRSLIPTFKETDVFVELEGPPGASMQAMDRATEAVIHDLDAWGSPAMSTRAGWSGSAMPSWSTLPSR